MSAPVCPGIPINSDISGPGVRIALYLQSLLSVLLVRTSPKDAPSAYWSMISTALSLIISSIVTGLLKRISLLDAIVVVYVLLLPVVASAFGISELMSTGPETSSLRRAHSPLLILANWIRSALTYAFAIYVWVTAPTFGEGPPECNEATRLIFFGASLPALGSGRILNLVGWGFLTSLFVWRTLKGSWTLFASLRALFSSSPENVLLKPKKPPANELNLETVNDYNYRTGAHEHRERAFRPRQIFHEVLQGMMSQILGWAPAGRGTWYKKYGQAILACLVSAWAITMTELELKRNKLAEDVNREWGFGQILPLILTIAPLFSLYEAILAKKGAGPLEESKRTIRFCVRSASGLKRPRCELDGIPDEVLLKTLSEDQIKAFRAPSPFAVLTIDEKDMYTTYDMKETSAPDWGETFDAEVDDKSTIVIRVFDLKCMDRGWPSLIGYTTILPFSLLPPPLEVTSGTQSTPSAETLAGQEGEGQEGQEGEGQGTTVVRSGAMITTVPLVRERATVPGMNLELSLSLDTSGPVPPSNLPSHHTGLKGVEERRSVALIKFRGGKKYGKKKTTLTETYYLP